MPFKSDERIRESSTTQGAGTYTLGGAPVGYTPFSSLAANSYCPYFATDGTDWEVGIGQYLAGPDRLTRDAVIRSSNGNAAVVWGATGTRTLRCGFPAWLALPTTTSKAVAGGAGTTVLTQREQRVRMLTFTGALTGNRVIEVDATQWDWIVFNNTTGAFTLTFRVTGQVGVGVPQGARRAIYCDGTDCFKDDPIDDGAAMLFAQTSAPTGWTKSTTHNDKALRVVSGAAASGGATAFTSVFGASKTAGATTLSATQIPTHTHNPGAAGSFLLDTGGAGVMAVNAGAHSYPSTGSTDGGTGGGGSHNHTLSLDLQYVDVIIATKG